MGKPGRPPLHQAERRVAPTKEWGAEARAEAKKRGLNDTTLGEVIGASQPSTSAVLNADVGASVLVDRISRVLDIDSPVPLPEDAAMARKLRKVRTRNPKSYEALARLIHDASEEE